VFLVLGINHRTAPLRLRERVAFDPAQMVAALQQAHSQGHRGVAVLSTCNRTELYLDTRQSAAEALVWLAGWHEMEVEPLAAASYNHSGRAAIEHLMRVASGLDSMVLGEPQILGQLKSAYATALDAGTLSSALHRVFQHGFAAAKRIRRETAIGQNPVSVACAAVRMGRELFTDLDAKTAMLVGAGETVRLVSKHLVQQGVNRLLIFNRTQSRAQQLATQIGGAAEVEVGLLSDMPQQLHRADILISSTASQLPILGKGAVESALKKRTASGPLFMVDIAVPRDIEPEVAELPAVRLFTVDDLVSVVEQNRRSRQAAAQGANAIIAECAAHWERDVRGADRVDIVRLYRGRSASTRDAELDKAQRALSAGEPPEKVLERLASNLTKKLIHHPTTQLNRLLSEDQAGQLNTARRLLGLETAEQEAD